MEVPVRIRWPVPPGVDSLARACRPKPEWTAACGMLPPGRHKLHCAPGTPEATSGGRDRSRRTGGQVGRKQPQTGYGQTLAVGPPVVVEPARRRRPRAGGGSPRHRVRVPLSRGVDGRIARRGGRRADAHLRRAEFPGHRQRRAMAVGVAPGAPVGVLPRPGSALPGPDPRRDDPARRAAQHRVPPTRHGRPGRRPPVGKGGRSSRLRPQAAAASQRGHGAGRKRSCCGR